MASPANVPAFDYDNMYAAAHRWYQHEDEGATNESMPPGEDPAPIDTPERLAKRINRLTDAVRAVNAPREDLPPTMRKLVSSPPVRAGDVSDILFERVMGETRDFLSVSFLEEGLRASRSVGRVYTVLADGRIAFGTGFMVSPRLMITNRHVLTDAATAGRSLLELNYQRDCAGNALELERFQLRPDLFFLNDAGLDFALVAVAEESARRTPLKGFGFSPLIGAEGKIVISEKVNIIQHPRGEMKQVVVRENKLIRIPSAAPDFAHYEADTEPGSSGSPVYSDQWEVIALHHQGVPKKDDQGNFLDKDDRVWRQGDDPARLAWAGNEGVRVSSLVRFIGAASLPGAQRRFRDELIAEGKRDDRPAPRPQPGPESSTNGVDRIRPRIAPKAPQPVLNNRPSKKEDIMPSESNPGTPGSQTITVTLPLTITISVGSPGQSGGAGVMSAAMPGAQENFAPDPDYSNRPGFDTGFLGFATPLPKLTNSIRSQALRVGDGDGDDAFELKYYHYSVIMNRPRKVAFVSAVNIDTGAPVRVKREGSDKWTSDPRAGHTQTGEALYAGNPLDRGHLTRRADAAWGQTEAEANAANNDTFHFTNCSPQHEVYNQGQKARQRGLLLWGTLEDHVAAQAAGVRGGRVCVYNGPVFRASDAAYRGVQLPKEFYKLIAYEGDDGEPGVAAFILSQAQLIKNIAEEDFEAAEYAPFQVKVRDLESRTKLDFGAFRGFDALERNGHESAFESYAEVVPLGSLSDVLL